MKWIENHEVISSNFRETKNTNLAVSMLVGGSKEIIKLIEVPANWPELHGKRRKIDKYEDLS